MHEHQRRFAATCGFVFDGDLVSGKPWQVAAIAMLMLAATVSRVAMTMQPMSRNAWMATAAFYFLAATAIWTAFLLPVMLRRKG